MSIQENESKKKIMVAEKDFEAGEVIYTVRETIDFMSCEHLTNAFRQ